MIKVVNKKTYRGIDAVYVGRGSALGNPFSHLSSSKAQFRVATRDEAVDSYGPWLKAAIENDELVRKTFENLVGFYRDYGTLTLACWCAPKRCHAEVIRAMILERFGMRP